MELLMGVAREVISPEIGGNLYGYRPDIYSKSLHDDLTATAYAFTYGQTKVILCSITVCSIGTADVLKMRESICAQTGVPVTNIMLCATHTHTGPITKGSEGWGSRDDDYCNNILEPRVISAAVKAYNAQEEVTVGSAVGESFVGVNRRELTLKNTIALGQSPWDPFDPRMTILSFKNKEGKIVGNIVSYGCHGTCAGTDTAISRDWSGVMIDAMEEHTGGITAFFNDTIGDIGPRLSNGKTTGNISYVEEHGKVAAADAIRIFDQIKEYETVSVSACAETIKIPLEPRMSYEEATRLYDPELEKTLINLARKQQTFYRHVKESYESGYEEVSHKEISQTIIRLGQYAFVAFPYEVFSVIGLRIKRAVTDLRVLTLSNSNGSEGYFVTQDQLCRGGYEVGSYKTGAVQPYPDNGDFYLVSETLRNLEQLER